MSMPTTDPVSQEQEKNLSEFVQTTVSDVIQGLPFASSSRCSVTSCKTGTCKRTTCETKQSSCSRGIRLFSNNPSRGAQIVTASSAPCGSKGGQPRPCAVVQGTPTNAQSCPRSTTTSNRTNATVQSCSRGTCSFNRANANTSETSCKRVSSQCGGGGSRQTSENPLKIGSCVRIEAIPDLGQPRSVVRHIGAVILYVTDDGRYKLGTRLGMIGQLFREEELEPTPKILVKMCDVPSRSVNMREASTLSY